MADHNKLKNFSYSKTLNNSRNSFLSKNVNVEESNLSEIEMMGLESLKKTVATGELMITGTDKS